MLFTARLIFIVLTAALTAAGTALGQKAWPYPVDEKKPIYVDESMGEIYIFAQLQPEAFSGLFKMTSNYHAVVWKEGRAAGSSLIVSYVDDVTFHDALLQLGGEPGNNLEMAAWNERKNPKNPAPDTRIEGTPVEMLVWWPKLEKPLPVDSLFTDPGGKGIDLRFGGNKALIPEWRSGCFVCLYSCPGSKVGNHAYTIRDYVKGTTKFEANMRVLPTKKTRAVLIFRLKE